MNFSKMPYAVYRKKTVLAGKEIVSLQDGFILASEGIAYLFTALQQDGSLDAPIWINRNSVKKCDIPITLSAHLDALVWGFYSPEHAALDGASVFRDVYGAPKIVTHIFSDLLQAKDFFEKSLDNLDMVLVERVTVESGIQQMDGSLKISYTPEECKEINQRLSAKPKEKETIPALSQLLGFIDQAEQTAFLAACEGSDGKVTDGQQKQPTKCIYEQQLYSPCEGHCSLCTYQVPTS